MFQNAGMDVWCGMIVGFDSDDETIFDAQLEFLRDARILHAMLGMLHAIPKTPLHARLKAEGRLDENDTSEFGTNVIPRQLTRESLRDGHVPSRACAGPWLARLVAMLCSTPCWISVNCRPRRSARCAGPSTSNSRNRARSRANGSSAAS